MRRFEDAKRPRRAHPSHPLKPALYALLLVRDLYERKLYRSRELEVLMSGLPPPLSVAIATVHLLRAFENDQCDLHLPEYPGRGCCSHMVRLRLTSILKVSTVSITTIPMLPKDVAELFVYRAVNATNHYHAINPLFNGHHRGGEMLSSGYQLS